MAMHGLQLVASEWTFVFLSIILVVLRFYLRYGRRGRLIISDYLVIIAMILFAVEASLDTVLFRLGLFDGKVRAQATKWGLSVGLATKADTIKAMKIMFVQTTLYYCTMLATKCALLTFYYELVNVFSQELKYLRVAMNIITGLTVGGWVISILLKLFIEPISHNWAVGTSHWCAPYGLEANVAGWIWNIITSIFIFLLPLIFVAKFKIPYRETIFCAAFISFYGFISIALGIAAQISRTAPSSMNTGTSKDLNFAMSWLYFSLDQTFAILVVCCPVFKAVLCRETFTQVIEKFTPSGFSSTLSSRQRTGDETSLRSVTPSDFRDSQDAKAANMVETKHGWTGRTVMQDV